MSIKVPAPEDEAEVPGCEVRSGDRGRVKWLNARNRVSVSSFASPMYTFDSNNTAL